MGIKHIRTCRKQIKMEVRKCKVKSFTPDLSSGNLSFDTNTPPCEITQLKVLYRIPAHTQHSPSFTQLQVLYLKSEEFGLDNLHGPFLCSVSGMQSVIYFIK